MNAVTTRSGKQLPNPPLVEVYSEKLVPNDAIPDLVIVDEPVVNDNVVCDETVFNKNDATDTMTDAKHDKSKSKVTDILIKHVPFPQKLARVIT